MSLKSRNSIVFIAALLSIAITAALLNYLGNTPPPAGAFSLSEYYALTPIETVISFNVPRFKNRWAGIDIIYCPANPNDLNCHFVISNGPGSKDGRIQSTEKWQTQLPITSTQTRSDNNPTIQICVITDNKTPYPTDFQLTRVEALTQVLSRTFDIKPSSIHYPDNWRN